MRRRLVGHTVRLLKGVHTAEEVGHRRAVRLGHGAEPRELMWAVHSNSRGESSPAPSHENTTNCGGAWPGIRFGSVGCLGWLAGAAGEVLAEGRDPGPPLGDLLVVCLQNKYP